MTTRTISRPVHVESTSQLTIDIGVVGIGDVGIGVVGVGAPVVRMGDTGIAELFVLLATCVVVGFTVAEGVTDTFVVPKIEAKLAVVLVFVGQVGDDKEL